MPISNESKVSTAFSEGVANLLAELKLAIHWDRPSILLAIYKTESVRIKAEKVLEQELDKISQAVKRVQMDRAQPDVTQIILLTENSDRVVFSITGIRNAGGDDGKDAYRALNLYREIFVEHRIRIVLWLTENESRNLSQFAPDFWAFRHRVIEFALDRLQQKDILPSGVLLWSQQDPVSHPQKLKEDIQYYSQMLADLPERRESVSIRTDVLFKLAYFDWMYDNLVDAKRKLISGFELADRLNVGHIKAGFLNALAIISYELQNREDAMSQLKKAIEINPQDSLLNINLGITYQSLGQGQNAIVAAKRATRLDPKNPRIWNALAHLFLASGRLEVAQSSFECALSLDPQNLFYHLGLVVCQFKAGDLDKVERSLDLVNRTGNSQSNYYQACEKALRGNSDEAIQILKAALRNNELLAPVLRRDPILQHIFDAEIIKSL